MNKRNAARGNALFLILIAVALFAALSYAVTQSGRGGGSIDRENTTIAASNIINYANTVRAAVQRMQLINGVADTAYRSATTCSASDCSGYIFFPAGGGVSYQAPSADGLDSAYASEGFYGGWALTSNLVTGIGTDAAVDTSSDLLLMLPWIKKSLCVEINNKLGVTNVAGMPPTDSPGLNLNNISGGYATTTINDVSGYLTGQSAGCFRATKVGATSYTTDTFHFYMVLLPR